MSKLKSLIHAATSRKLANDFISSERYTKETIKAIKRIERDIKYLSKRGFYEKYYEMFEISKAVDMSRIKKEFKSQGYKIYVEQWVTCESTYKIRINWENN